MVASVAKQQQRDETLNGNEQLEGIFSTILQSYETINWSDVYERTNVDFMPCYEVLRLKNGEYENFFQPQPWWWLEL